MDAMRQSWSDDRLDDLNRRVDEGFQRVDAQFARVDAQFARVDLQFAELRGEMNLRFERLDSRFDALQRTMIQVGGGMIGTLILAFGGVIATQL
jgi:hypothetical protein